MRRSRDRQHTRPGGEVVRAVANWVRKRENLSEAVAGASNRLCPSAYHSLLRMMIMNERASAYVSCPQFQSNVDPDHGDVGLSTETSSLSFDVNHPLIRLSPRFLIYDPRSPISDPRSPIPDL